MSIRSFMRFAVLVSAMLLLLTAPAAAHPGRTDAQGGHYNHSTGEYHFHNGENAGKSQNSSSSYYIPPSGVQFEPYPTARPTALTTARPTEAPSLSKSNQFDFDKYGKWLIFGAFVLIAAVIGLYNFITDHFELKKNYFALCKTERDIRDENERMKAESKRLSAENQKLSAEMKDVRDLMTSLFVAEHERDELLIECKQLRNSQRSYDVWYRSMANRLFAVQPLLSSEQRSRLALQYGRPLPPMAMVYVFGGKSHKFHTHVHGDWTNYYLIPLEEALTKGYEPCLTCAIRHLNDFRFDQYRDI